MNHLSPAEKREFLKSMEVERQTLLQEPSSKGACYLWKKTAQAQARWPDRAMDTRWVRTWKPDDSKPSGRRAKARAHQLRVSQTLTSLTTSHILQHLLVKVFMTVLQSVCSHGHKLQFGDVQHVLFNTGDPTKREQPLFVRMPPDGVPGASRDVWVQLLKTVNGLADGTRKWRNCFLATARGLGFETSVLGTLCFGA